MIHVLVASAYFVVNQREWQDVSIVDLLLLMGTVFWCVASLHAVADRCGYMRRFNIHPLRAQERGPDPDPESTRAAATATRLKEEARRHRPVTRSLLRRMHLAGWVPRAEASLRPSVPTTRGIARSEVPTPPRVDASASAPELRYIPLVVYNQALLYLISTQLMPRIWTPYSFWNTWLTTAAAATMLVQVFLYGLVYQLIFHVGHTALHRIRWLSPYHAKHHSTLANCGITSMYMHPLDAVIEIIMPVFLPIAILGLSTHCAAAVLCIVAIDGNITHGGYHLPYRLASDPRTHLVHHIHPSKNISIFVRDRS